MAGSVLPLLALVAGVLLAPSAAAGADALRLSPKEQLGRFLFFDANLSAPAGQACASCHAANAGFAGPTSEINAAGAVFEGAEKGRFGNRKPPSASYGGDSPVLHFDRKEKVWIGGMFGDGRATGRRLNDPLAEQAQGPLLNPLEQNIPETTTLCTKVKNSSYAGLFERVWGDGALDCGKNVSATFDRIARSVAAYERSREVNPFSSKFDLWLRKKARLSDEEMRGLKLFEGKGKCAQCHPSKRGRQGAHPLFTDFTYDNLGIPKNPKNPFYAMPPRWNPDGAAFVDLGLGGHLRASGFARSVYEPEMGKFKVPTLRNVGRVPARDFVKAFGHNGYFKSLKAIVHFYNTRDVLSRCETVRDPRPGIDCWPQPEVSSNINAKEMGDLGLSERDEDAIVAFLQTLSDGYEEAN